ncbi:hypothetical protein [Streptomyces sp. NPDC057460]|uniref:hypothetical protein n=1 Tax=Streptomyces sp. NPDC057460 TaxID=3346141 RepID=UPI00368CA078
MVMVITGGPLGQRPGAGGDIAVRHDAAAREDISFIVPIWSAKATFGSTRSR